MKNVKLIISGLTALLLINCGGGGPISNLVKWRDENKNLGIACNITMSKPGTAEESKGNGDGSTRTVKNGEWNANEKAEYQKWANNQCQDIISFLQKSLNYKNVEIVDLNKVPKGEAEFFGKKFPFSDFSQTRYDYVWQMNIEAKKSAQGEEPTATARIGKYECATKSSTCINFDTSVRMSYLVEDWSKKDLNKKSFVFQDYFFASCSSGNANKDIKTLTDVTEADFFPLASKDFEKCQTDEKKKYANFQKEIDELNSKKK